MTKLSELIAADTNPPRIWGIVVDEFDVTPPNGLREAGLVCPTSGGEIDNDVLDIAISWVLAGIDVTLEIPAEAEIRDAQRTLFTVAAVGISVSLLLPEKISEETFASYCTRVWDFASVYVTQANMTKFVTPVTSYLGYMFIEVLNPSVAEDFQPTDEYVLTTFHNRISTEQADYLKAGVRSVFVDAYGGEEGFAAYARSLTGTIYRKVEESCLEEAARVFPGADEEA